MLHRLAAGIAAAIVALSIWHSAAGTPSLAPTTGATAGCPLSPVASAAWTRLAAHLPPASACPQAIHLNHRIAPALLAQFPHTAVELNGRVYLDMVLSASPPPPGTP